MIDKVRVAKIPEKRLNFVYQSLLKTESVTATSGQGSSFVLYHLYPRGDSQTGKILLFFVQYTNVFDLFNFLLLAVHWVSWCTALLAVVAAR